MNKILVFLICLGVVYGFSKSSKPSKTFVYNVVDTFINKTQQGSATTLINSRGGSSADSAVIVLGKQSFSDTTSANYSVVCKYAGVIITTSNGSYWIRKLNPNKWVEFTTGGGNIYVKYTDTATMLTPYHKSFYTASFDTGSRNLTLTPITGNAPTVVNIPRGGSVNGITSLTPTRSSNIVTLTGDNGSITQFSVRDADSLTQGTVTSIATNNGTGINGGTITTTGTLTIDTSATIATKWYVNQQAQGSGGSINYYLNGSIPSGITSYQQMSRIAVIGSGTDYTITSTGYIASFLTDANDPSQLNIPQGNWIVRCYFQANSPGGSPYFYPELYKYNGSTFTLIASGSTNPGYITNGTNVDLYTTALAVPATTLSLTDRLAIRLYVNPGGKTITLHTEDSNIDEITTTFSTGVTAVTASLPLSVTNTTTTPNITIDSTNSIYGMTTLFQNNKKLNISDTSSMLSHSTLDRVLANGNSTGRNAFLGYIAASGASASPTVTGAYLFDQRLLSINSNSNARSFSIDAEYLTFKTGNTYSEKARIDSFGSLLLGTSTSNAGAYKLDISGSARISSLPSYTSGGTYVVSNSGILSSRTAAQVLADIAAVGIADTAAMLSPYLRKSDTSTLVSNYMKRDFSNVTGTLGVANGGTGLTSLTSQRIPFGNGTSAFGSSASLFWDGTFLQATNFILGGGAYYAGGSSGGNGTLMYNNNNSLVLKSAFDTVRIQGGQNSANKRPIAFYNGDANGYSSYIDENGLFTRGSTQSLSTNTNEYATTAFVKGQGYLTTAVTSAIGTANQVLVNGGTSAQTGAVTFTLPQSIATTSDVQFGTVVGSATATYSSGTSYSLAATPTTTFSGTLPSSGVSFSSVLAPFANVISDNTTVNGNTPFGAVLGSSVSSFSNAAYKTLTMSNSTTGLKANSAIVAGTFDAGTQKGNITASAGLMVNGIFKSGTYSLKRDNHYQLLINGTDEFANADSVTNKWGVYQVGANDINYFHGTVRLVDSFLLNQRAFAAGYSGVAGFNIDLTSTSANPFITYAFNNGQMKAPEVYNSTVGGTNRDLYIDNTGLIGYVSSIRASKNNIAVLDSATWLNKLSPVTFNYRKKDKDGKYTDDSYSELEYGLIAEEVEKINPELVFYDIDSTGKKILRGVSYSKLIIPILKEVQRLKLDSDNKQLQIDILKAKNDDLQQQLNDIKALLLKNNIK